MKRKLIVMVLMFLLSFTKPRYGGQLCILFQEPLSLNPYEASFSDLSLFSLLWTNIFERIDGNFTSAVFEKWESSVNKKEWKFILKEGLSFSNSSPISSSDIKRAIELYLLSEQPGSKALATLISGGKEFLAGSSNHVSGISALNTSELVIKLTKSGEDLPDFLSSPYIFLYTGLKNTFSGPYILSSWEKGESIILKPNPYFGRGRVFLDGMKIVFKKIAHLDFNADEPISSLEAKEIEGKRNNIFMFLNPKSLNQNSRLSLYSLFRNNFPNSNLFEFANSYLEERELGYTVPFPISLQRFVFPELKLDIAVEKGLELLSPFIEKILKSNGIEPEIIYVPSFQIKKLLDTQYFQVVIFIPSPSPFYSNEKLLLYYIEEYDMSKHDENFVAIKNLIKELESVDEENRKMESLFYVQKNMLENAVLLPLCRIKTKFYLNKKYEGLKIDDYGRPLFWGVRMVSPL